MNNTKWNEIFHAFLDIEYSTNSEAPSFVIPWMTKDKVTGFEYGWDATWTHFSDPQADYSSIEWCKIKLTKENTKFVLDTLRKIHVPGEILDGFVIIYGYQHSEWI